MVVTYLIDGYNLMYAVGLLRAGLPTGGLERARHRFLDWLADSTSKKGEVVRVIFDARMAPAPSLESLHRGIRVRFAFGQTADDLIEELLEIEQVPHRVTVVSNDNRVRDAGRHRGSEAKTCEEFVDWLIQDPANESVPPPEAEKPDVPATEDEMAAWLAAFSRPKRKT